MVGDHLVGDHLVGDHLVGDHLSMGTGSPGTGSPGIKRVWDQMSRSLELVADKPQRNKISLILVLNGQA